MPVCVATAALLILFPPTGLGKAAENGLSIQVLALHLGDPEEAPDFSQYQPGPLQPCGE